MGQSSRVSYTISLVGDVVQLRADWATYSSHYMPAEASSCGGPYSICHNHSAILYSRRVRTPEERKIAEAEADSVKAQCLAGRERHQVEDMFQRRLRLWPIEYVKSDEHFAMRDKLADGLDMVTEGADIWLEDYGVWRQATSTDLTTALDVRWPYWRNEPVASNHWRILSIAAACLFGGWLLSVIFAAVACLSWEH